MRMGGEDTGNRGPGPRRVEGWGDGGRAEWRQRLRQIGSNYPHSQHQTHTHTPRCLSVWDSCPNRFCPVCKYLWGPQAGLGVSESFSPSLPPSQPERSASRKLLSASSGSRTQPLPSLPSCLPRLPPHPSPARSLPLRPCRRARVHTHAHTLQPSEMHLPPTPGVWNLSGIPAGASQPWKALWLPGGAGCGPQTFLLAIPVEAEAPSGRQGQGEVRSSWDLFGGNRVESRSLGPDFWTLNPV